MRREREGEGRRGRREVSSELAGWLVADWLRGVAAELYVSSITELDLKTNRLLPTSIFVLDPLAFQHI